MDHVTRYVKAGCIGTSAQTSQGNSEKGKQSTDHVTEHTENIRLTPSLTLVRIEENKSKGEMLITVIIYFRFHGQLMEAYLLIDKLDKESADFVMVESVSDLHDSFIDQLEENWRGIVKAVKAYHEKWKTF